MGGSATVFGVEDLIKLHKGFIQRGTYRRLGRMVKIVLGEVPRGVGLNLSKKELLTEGRTLDWFDHGPLLGLSPADVDLLVTSPVVPLPMKPEPGWEGRTAEQAEIEQAVAQGGTWKPDRAPLVRQIPEDRGARRMKGTNILLFEPVYQVLFRPIGTNVYGCVQAIHSPESPTVLTFVWNFDDGTGYFYGGRFDIKI